MDFDELRQAIGSNDQSRVEEVLEAANDTLKARFKATWKQSGTFVRLRVDGDQLHVFASNKPGDYIAISERSDGLRQFVALFAYVERYNDRPAEPILLVDEAERHLHYDAQADLVRAFTRQTSAAKVIYTTHSAGCLPQDLGNGVRIIAPVGPEDQPADTWDRSCIRNWFWTDGPGFAPLLIGMGASALAFSATQRAVMTEGIVDAMLMPTLFREATDNQDVGFQVAPALAEIAPEAIKDIDLIAARVAYLLDADEGGRAHKQKLLDAGVPENRIVLLPAADGEDLAVEDLIVEQIYREAVNAELESRGLEIDEATALPSSGRSSFVKAWCTAHPDKDGDTAPPGKRAVAQRILEEREDQAILDPARTSLVAKLHKELEGILKLPPHAS
jgi:predicted ATP-dependent endonuclease of OLD family